MQKKGFTLIELLVVIAIIGMLASVVLASLNTARSKSRDAVRISDMKQYQLALQLFYDNNRTFPVTLSELVTSGLMPVQSYDPLGNQVSYYYNPYKDSALSQACAAADETAKLCLTYHIGADLENGNPVLVSAAHKDDSGSAVSILGKSSLDANGNVSKGCTGTAGRYCYDVTP